MTIRDVDIGSSLGECIATIQTNPVKFKSVPKLTPDLIVKLVDPIVDENNWPDPVVDPKNLS